MVEEIPECLAFIVAKKVDHALRTIVDFTEIIHATRIAQPKRTCSNFVEKAAKDYQDEFSQLTKLSDDMSNDATDAMQDMRISTDGGAIIGE